MLTRLRPSDDQSLEALIAPPGLDDGLQSLGYWRERRRRLPWYRRRARREAELMALRWEGRLGGTAAGHTCHADPVARERHPGQRRGTDRGGGAPTEPLAAHLRAARPRRGRVRPAVRRRQAARHQLAADARADPARDVDLA